MRKRKTHYYQELNREFRILAFEVEEVQMGDKLILKYPTETFIAILRAIELGVNENLSHVPCLMIGDAVL